VATLDLTFAKVLRFDRVRFRFGAEVLNATNAQPMIWVNNVGTTTTPGNYLQPRTFQLVARAGF
jgi:hypothetical protein